MKASDWTAAKAAVAQIAAAIAALIVTVVVSILTAGLATGPVAVILLGALSGAAGATAAAATTEAIQGTGYEFGDEGLRTIAMGAVTGAVTAGSTYYIGQLVRGLSGASSAITQGQAVARVAATRPPLLRGIMEGGGEGVLQTG